MGVIIFPPPFLLCDAHFFYFDSIELECLKKPIAYAIHHHFPFYDFRICIESVLFFPLHRMRKLDQHFIAPFKLSGSMNEIDPIFVRPYKEIPFLYFVSGGNHHTLPQYRVT